ncbi:MAG TPA: TraB/GumN family protein [Hyphomonadaceae bacterium]|nr:TraB/GumN family protein [Hyphomonadaceae bacterium]
MTSATPLLRPIRRWLAAFAGAFTFALPAAAEPALWVIRDRDSTIYLFGTVHVLRGETQWLSPRIEAAAKASDELWLETPSASMDDIRASLALLVKKHGIGSAPLTSHLTSEEREALKTETRLAGLAPNSLDRFQPWFAALSISASALTQAGYDRAAGADAVLGKMFADRSIAPKGFETADQQIELVTRLSEQDQLPYLRAAFGARGRVGPEEDKMIALWAAGDVDGIAASNVAGIKASSPDIYDRMLVQRNAAWAGKIEKLLAGKGTVFIAVGAAHLAGPDSIQAQLGSHEIRAERLN